MDSQTGDVNINSIFILEQEKEKEEKKILTNGFRRLNYLLDKRSMTEKIVWGIVLLISLSGCVWMIFEMLEKYQNSPIVIGISNELGFIHEIPFPAITICPETVVSNNKFNYEVVQSKLEEKKTLSNKERRILYYMRLMCPESKYLYEEMVDPYVTFKSEGILDVMKEVAPTSPFNNCEFMDERYNCTDIFTRVITSEGICYSFNIMDRSEIFKKQVFHYEDFHQVDRNSLAFDGEIGYNGKISADDYPRRALISNTGPDLAFDLRQFSNEINTFCRPFSKRYWMKLHLPSETYERNVRESTYYLISSEESSDVLITPELTRASDKIKNYPVEKRKCYLKGEKELKYFQIYTQSNCNLECLTNITLSTCGCVDFYMPRMNGTEFICDLEHHDCIENVERDLYEKAIESSEANSHITNYYFGCNCLPLCTELKYNLDIFHLDVPRDKIYWTEGENESISTIVINFKSPSFSVLERNELYDTTDLIVNFGAFLVLFAGFSLISLAKIIYFLRLRM